MLRALIGTTVIAGALAAASVSNSPVMSLTASKQQSSTTDSITLQSSDPALGVTVFFANTYPNGTKNPADEVTCSQNGSVVWGEILSISQEQQYGFLLGGDSSPWVTDGGSASCTAQLVSVNFKQGVETITVLASDSFSAAA